MSDKKRESRSRRLVHLTDFCSYGEREEDE